MSRPHYPHTNPETGSPECLYANCGTVIPTDYYLCKKHYFRMQEGLIEPCPGNGCRRFKSISFDFCAVCSQHLEAESDPAWDAGDEGCSEFFTYLLVSEAGDWYAGHTRNLRHRMWMHQAGRCVSTREGAWSLAWFAVHPTRTSAADRELELKRLAATDVYGLLEIVFAFQDRISLVQPLTLRRP